MGWASRRPARATGTNGRARVRAVAAIVAAGILPALLAGCAGTSSPPEGGSTPTASAPSSYLQDALAYARCVRAHGVPDFPDPDSDGTFPKAEIPGGNTARLTAADQACGHLLPAQGTRQPVTTADQKYYIAEASCMRSHGISEFPDPTFPNGAVDFAIPTSIDTTTPRFRSARETCVKLIPAGLPYGRPAG